MKSRALAILLLLFGATAQAQLVWDWSFDGEQGTLITAGSLDQLAAANEFEILSFSLDVSVLVGFVGATFPVDEGQALIWDGDQVVGFSMDGAGEVFLSIGSLTTYTFATEPALNGLLVSGKGANTALAMGPLTVTPPMTGTPISPAQPVPLSPLGILLLGIGVLVLGLRGQLVRTN